MKNICGIISLCFLYGCVSIPKEEIVKDQQNIEKIEEIKSVLNGEVLKTADNKCKDNVYKLNKIVEKDKIDSTDYKTIKDIFSTNYDGSINVEHLNCSVNIEASYKSQRKRFADYCYEKYHDENDIVSTVLFPLRLVNATLVLTTMGVWCIFSTCHSRYSSDDFDLKNKRTGITAGFSLWAPGYTWNSDICENMFPDLSEFGEISFVRVSELQEKLDSYLEEQREKLNAKNAKEQKERIEKVKEEVNRRYVACMQDPECKKEYTERARISASCHGHCGNAAKTILDFAKSNMEMKNKNFHVYGKKDGCFFADQIRDVKRNFSAVCSLPDIFKCMTESERKFFQESFKGCFM